MTLAFDLWTGRLVAYPVSRDPNLTNLKMPIIRLSLIEFWQLWFFDTLSRAPNHLICQWESEATTPLESSIHELPVHYTTSLGLWWQLGAVYRCAFVVLRSKIFVDCHLFLRPLIPTHSNLEWIWSKHRHKTSLLCISDVPPNIGKPTHFLFGSLFHLTWHALYHWTCDLWETTTYMKSPNMACLISHFNVHGTPVAIKDRWRQGIFTFRVKNFII